MYGLAGLETSEGGVVDSFPYRWVQEEADLRILRLEDGPGKRTGDDHRRSRRVMVTKQTSLLLQCKLMEQGQGMLRGLGQATTWTHLLCMVPARKVEILLGWVDGAPSLQRRDTMRRFVQQRYTV